MPKDSGRLHADSKGGFLPRRMPEVAQTFPPSGRAEEGTRPGEMLVRANVAPTIAGASARHGPQGGTNFPTMQPTQRNHELWRGSSVVVTHKPPWRDCLVPCMN